MFLVFASGTVPSPAHGLPCCHVRASGWTVVLSWKVPTAMQVAVAAEPLSSGVHESPFSLSFSASARAGLTGQAGTTRQTSHRTVFVGHATAYRWDGSKLTRLTVPVPRGGRDAELAGVSCPSTTFCLAVGNYIRADGKSQAYSARWSGGTWTVQNARNLKGQVLTLFEGVSCVSRTRCEAVGTTLTPGNRAFAEAWSSGTWQTQPSAGKANATLFGVTCPAAGRCFAAGSLGDLSLIEVWDGTHWSAQATPVTAAPRSGSALNHVSCTTPDLCEAVGYRFSRSRSDVTPHTLALGWDGQRWKVQPTVNQ